MTTKIQRASSPELDAILGDIFPVHNLGHVRVIDYLGNDQSIVQMARVSYGEGTKTVSEDRGLIRYLMKHKHTSPFEGCQIKLHLKMPLFVARQWVRHRTAAMNEVSARYSEMPDEFYYPVMDDVQLQSTTNKQGSEEGLDFQTKTDFIVETVQTSKDLYNNYKESLEKGMAREMARINLPLTMYTEFYWSISLHNLMHFLRLRCDKHAQKQIRDYADVILNTVVKAWVPNTYEAFLDYSMNAVTLSNAEFLAINDLIAGESPDAIFSENYLTERGMGKREANEFISKFYKEHNRG